MAGRSSLSWPRGAGSGAGLCLVRADAAGPRRDSGAAGPAGAGEPRAGRAGPRDLRARNWERPRRRQPATVEEQARHSASSASRSRRRPRWRPRRNFPSASPAWRCSTPSRTRGRAAGRITRGRGRHRPGARPAATVRQTIIGLEFGGPQAIWGGKVTARSTWISSPAARTTRRSRLRTGSIEIDWKDRSVMAGLEKPIFNPREPSSLAQVGISPLTGAGNLWLWLPQVRFEQDFRFARPQRLARAGGRGADARDRPVRRRPSAPEAARPGLEGRFEFYHKLDDERRLEIAAGFHASTTHAGGFSIPSNLLLARLVLQSLASGSNSPARSYSGQNVAHLGSGTRQGYAVYEYYAVRDRRARGGWGQLTLHAAAAAGFPPLHRPAGRCQSRSLADGRSARTCCSAATSISAWRRMSWSGWKLRRCAPMYIWAGSADQQSL